MTVGEKVRELRERLDKLPAREDCRSFAGLPLYDLGHGFFPGHLGLYAPDRESVSTIVLGSDWGNEEAFAEYLKRERHRDNNTVAGTNKLLTEAGFTLADCFYTNAWPVMRVGNAKEQGHHAMRDDVAFTARCQDYLRHTLKTLNIRLVISLGNPCAWFLGPFFGPDWKLGQLKSSKHVKIRDLDVEPLRSRDGIVFVNATHPAHLAANRKKRHLSGSYGCETRLLIHARQLAGIS